LDVYAHRVHIGEPLLHRCELDARSLRLLSVDLARARVGEHIARSAFYQTRRAEHCFGCLGQDMTVDVHGEMLAARMWWARKAAENARVFGQATEQRHAITPPRRRSSSVELS